LNRFLELSVLSPNEWTPRDISEVISWQGHIPFAFSLIRLFTPACLVELGTHKGDSYLAFCEAAHRYSPATRCFAIDTWTGDEHAGYYGDEILENLQKLHNPLYSSFSTLIRSTFDNALAKLPDGSIDLLHIDGLHTYEAVRHDFESWQSKLSDKGIVLFHDTQVHQSNFGVWKYWSELSLHYPHFEFSHSNGLGVLAVGKHAAEALPDLFNIDANTAAKICTLFSVIGNSIAFNGQSKLLLLERQNAASEIAQLREQLDASNHALDASNHALDASNLALAATNQTLNDIIKSTSWRMTFPLRRMVTIARFVAENPKAFWVLIFRKIYHRLPFATVTRNRLKSKLYRLFPGLFSDTLSYDLWRSQAVGVIPELFEIKHPNGVQDAFELMLPDEPMVSIVIPVYGKVDYTYRCLQSLWSHRSHYSFEVIVVDDCSPDNTAEVLKSINGLRLVSNDTNLGFIRSCNLGASHAKGQLLVVLNNDTVVLQNWLDELVNTFNCIPLAGLVGSKLTYPDGRLQEAGGVIWRDGSAWNYGRLQNPDEPRYNYLRDVDYCSGASLMITKKLFDELGGFDEHYLPAYGEDSDLAFRVRQAGYRVLYQPLSQLVHFEGITSGKDPSSGVKAYQLENARKLHARWQTVLAGHGEPGVLVEQAKDRGICGRILVLDHCTPTPDQDAGSITALNLMRIVQALGFKVSFAPEDNFLYITPYTRDLQRIGIECLYAPYVTSLEQHLAESGSIYDIVIIFRVTTADRNLTAIRKYCPTAKIVFHTSDLHHLRELREAELAQSEALRHKAETTKCREIGIIRAVDATIVHSTAEKELLDLELAREGSLKQVCLFSWAIEVPDTQAPFEQRDGMVFVGGFQHQPNVDAVCYFAEQIFPLIRQKIPHAVFRIIGSKATPEIHALAGNGIEVIGFVEDLRSKFDHSLASVIPLRYGAGIKGKIGTSLSYGLPCVSSTIGVEGMDLRAGDGVLVEDDPAAFADAIIRLHQDALLWETCSQGGLDFVKRNYSFEAGVEVIRKLFLDIGVAEIKLIKRPLNAMHGQNGLVKTLFPADQMEDPLESVSIIRNKAEYDSWSEQPTLKNHRNRELILAKDHAHTETYHLPGYCRLCEREVDFLVDRQCGATEMGGVWLPNWRERMTCLGCGLNNRQRMMALTARNRIGQLRDKRPDVYLMEMVTPIYHWLSTSVPQARYTGSEYLGEDIKSGKIIKGIRHEDVERLSFDDNSFDLVISNDVLEHVLNPDKALLETCRILRPQGVLLMTVPFHLDKENNERRAEWASGGIKHLLPPCYHGNPLSDKGSLVVTDFGWDFLQNIRNAGFTKAELRFYWSEVYGHLGAGQHYIYAVKE